MQDIFTSEPWNADQTGVAGLPPGMLGQCEASLLYHLARDYFKGYGDIVDAGAFLGASSWCLTKGIEENVTIVRKSGRVHAYDLFQVWSEPGGSDDATADWMRASFGLELAGYESTIGIYARNLGPLARHVRIYQGDLLEQQWSGRPIEIMFVDVCKTKAVWQHVLRIFYGSLVPGISVVVHQDWHHPWLPYLHVGQEALADYFEVVVAKANDSAVFRLIDRIPERVLDRVANYEFSRHQELALMSRAVDRFAARGKASFMRLAQAELLRQQGRNDEASRLIDAAVMRTLEPMSVEERTWFEVNAAGVAKRVEADAMGEAPAGFEGGYLEANPDVILSVDGGHFESGYHHWFRHGRWEGRPTRPRARVE